MASPVGRKGRQTLNHRPNLQRRGLPLAGGGGLEREGLEGGEGGGAGLGGDHAPEAGEDPRPDVVVLPAHRDQVVRRQRHLERGGADSCRRCFCR